MRFCWRKGKSKRLVLRGCTRVQEGVPACLPAFPPRVLRCTPPRMPARSPADGAAIDMDTSITSSACPPPVVLHCGFGRESKSGNSNVLRERRGEAGLFLLRRERDLLDAIFPALLERPSGRCAPLLPLAVNRECDAAVVGTLVLVCEDASSRSSAVGFRSSD